MTWRMAGSIALIDRRLVCVLSSKKLTSSVSSPSKLSITPILPSFSSTTTGRRQLLIAC
ncbi:Uncharacterised protein [Enterobacter cloacae]|nr:Uncharacterised protein [Enterobacter cloacae]